MFSKFITMFKKFITMCSKFMRNQHVYIINKFLDVKASKIYYQQVYLYMPLCILMCATEHFITTCSRLLREVKEQDSISPSCSYVPDMVY